MSGDIDSRVSDSNDYNSDAPGANDNASGLAGTLEAAKVLSQYSFKNSIIYVGLSGEEQGLFGGQGLANFAKKKNWDIIGVLNNDMIGNIKGVDGVMTTVHSEYFLNLFHLLKQKNNGYQDVIMVAKLTVYQDNLHVIFTKRIKTYMPEMNPMMIYRLDRFGRGGHHKPFCDAGYAGIRIMETHENYTQQHQDIRTENGIEYGDTFEYVNFNYAKKLTAVNAINLASLAWAPPAPTEVSIGGIVEPSAKLKWNAVSGAAYYKVYWRDTTSPTWDYSKIVSKNSLILDGLVIDNYFFGVATVGENGFESQVVFPNKIFR